MKFSERVKGFFGGGSVAKQEDFFSEQNDYFDNLVSWRADGTPYFNADNGERYITEGYQKNAAIYSIINMITRNATMIPFKLYDVRSRSLKKDYNALTSGTITQGAVFKASTIKAQAFTEVEENGLLDLLNRPNPHQTWSDFISNYIGFGKLTGNRYIYLVRDGKNRVREMYLLPSQHVEIISGDQFNPVKGYTVQYHKEKTIDYTPEEILHIKDFNPYHDFSGSHLYGQSPLRAGWQTLEINNEAVETTKKQMSQQSARGLLVAEDMDGISKAQAKALDYSMRQKLKNSNGSIAMSNTPMKWVNFGLSPADLELIAQHDVSLKGLCNLYGVPVVLMNNTESSSYNNIKEAKSFLFQNAVNPEMIKLRDALNNTIVGDWGNNLYLDFDFTVIPELQEDISEMVNQLDKAWYMTPNQKRKTLYLAEDTENEQMDRYFVPVNLMPMENMLMQSQQFLNEAARLNPALDVTEETDGDEQ